MRLTRANTANITGALNFARVLHQHPDKVARAGAKALDRTAYEVRANALLQLDRQFNLRNTWTARGVRYIKTRGHRLDRLIAIVGAVNRPYLRDQERGYETRSPQYTEVTRVRNDYKTGVPRRAHHLRGEKIRKPGTLGGGGSSKASRQAMFAIARREGWGKLHSRQYFYFDFRGKKAYYQFRGKDLVMTHRFFNLRRNRPRKWLDPAVTAAGNAAIISKYFMTRMRRLLRQG